MMTAISERTAAIVGRQLAMFRAGSDIQREAVFIISEALEIDTDDSLELCNRCESAVELMDRLGVEVYPDDPDSPEEKRLAEMEAKEEWRDMEAAGLIVLGTIMLMACCVLAGYWIAQ